MKSVVAFLLTLAVALPLGATAQQPDQIRIGNDTYPLHAGLQIPGLDRLPKGAGLSSSLWRGYIAVWALRENRLFLDDIKVPSPAYRDFTAPESKRFRSVMKSVFGQGGTRVATWYTGHLVVPTGELEHYVHMGFASTYSSYLVATVVGGSVRETREMDAKRFEAFRRKQFEAWKKTPAYARTRAELENDKEADEFLFAVAAGEYQSILFPRRK